MLSGMIGIVLSVVAVQQLGPGPGDPTTVYASGFGGGPMGMAAALSGDLYVTDHQRNLIARIAPDRQVTSFAAIDKPEQLAFDGFGDLLVTAENRVWRVTLAGERSLFANVTGARPIAIGPDGDVWVGGDSAITRFSPLGVRKQSIGLPIVRLAWTVRTQPEPRVQCLRALSLAFSPTGALHFTSENCGAVFRLAGNASPRRR